MGAIGSSVAHLLESFKVADPERDGAIVELDDRQATTSGLLQAHLPQSHVVKAFNNIFFEHLLSLARPAGAPDRNTLILAGDDAAAKQTATGLLDAIGYDALDSGSLAESWRYERDQPAYATAYAEDGDFDRPRASGPERLQALLAEATR